MWQFIFCIALLLAPLTVQGEVLTEDTLWQGKVEIREDVLVPEGVTLTLAAGTAVRVQAAESTKIDPEYLSHQTEIMVRGTLKILGESNQRVSFSLSGEADQGRWAGIIVDGGVVAGQWFRISNAEHAVLVVRGTANLAEAIIEENHYGLVAQSAAAEVALHQTRIRKNDYGLMIYDGAAVTEVETEIADNEKANRFSGNSKLVKILPKVYEPLGQDLTRVLKNETLLGSNVWQGKVRIDGQVRLAPEAQLVILPGTVVEFSKRDTNGDGLGENGILIQGVLWAKGTAAKPIIFRSAEAEARLGDWDAINILGSDQARNLIEFCQIEDAYRGLHFHFSNVAVTNSVIRHNYRGLQFQESLVEIRDNQFYRNKSAIQARDSEVMLTGNSLFANLNGANLFRLNLTANDNLFANNRGEGLRIREGAATVVGNEMLANRFGLLVADAVFGRFSGNVLAGNIEAGLALRNTDNIETRQNAIVGNGMNGMIVRESRGLIKGNFIAANGERGIGLQSFSGQVTGNNIVGNGRYGLGLEGGDNIAAAQNWWGESDLAAEIFDQNDDPRLGLVSYEPVMAGPQPFVWPVARVSVDLAWAGEIVVERPLTVQSGAALTVKPGTIVRFDQGVGMEVFGRLEARGTERQRIVFTSRSKKVPAAWGEILLDRAMGSVLENCNFSYASFALHSHYVDLKLLRCLFENNDGGFRFNSGPVEVTQSLFRKNRIGIRSFRGIGTLRGNEFDGNEIAIYSREQASGVVIHHNNILASDRYNIRMGDFNDEDLDARFNWWGGVPVEDTVFDGNRESYIGRVRYEPVLEKPIVLDWPRGSQ